MVEIIPNWHPLFVHFTVALLLIATLLFVITTVSGKSRWSEILSGTAHVNLWLGAGFSLITVLAGFYAYNTVAHDGPSHAAMTDHRDWALPTASVWIALAIWAGFGAKKSGFRRSWLFLIATLAAAGLLTVTAFKGGEAVYRYGLGVISLPQIEGDGSHGSHHHGGDDHDHGEANDHHDSDEHDGSDEHDVMHEDDMSGVTTEPTNTPSNIPMESEPHNHDDHDHDDHDHSH